jgi:hypothetical protein
VTSDQDEQNVDAIVDAVVARLQNRREFVRYGLGVGICGLLTYLIKNGVPPAEVSVEVLKSIIQNGSVS